MAASERCVCPCHTHSGTYPPPCNFCGHDTRDGRWVGGYRGWWEPNNDPRDEQIGRLTALLAERDAEIARLREQVTSLELDKRAIYAVLSRYSYAVLQTRYPKMDNSQWNAVNELAHEQPVIKQIAEARAALAARDDGNGWG